MHGSLGSKLDIKQKPIGSEVPEVFIERLVTNFRITMTHCVTDGSHLTYCTGYRTFKTFCEKANIDSTLKVVPTYVLTHNMSYNEYKLRIIGAFMSYCSGDMGLHPNTVISYTNGVRDTFRRENLDLSVFHHEQLKDMRKALHIDWRATHEEIAQTKTLPFTLDMMKTFERLTSTTDMEDAAMFVGAKI